MVHEHLRRVPVGNMREAHVCWRRAVDLQLVHMRLRRRRHHSNNIAHNDNNDGAFCIAFASHTRTYSLVGCADDYNNNIHNSAFNGTLKLLLRSMLCDALF